MAFVAQIPMMRKLRIAFSVACGIACLLLIAVWVRSYWWVTQIQTLVASSAVSCAFEPGRVRFESNLLRTELEKEDWTSGLFQWHKSSREYAGYNYDSPPFVIRFWKPARLISIIFPYWFAILITGAASIAPWICWRFSLRTLLIAMTLVAVVLGAIVWAMR